MKSLIPLHTIQQTNKVVIILPLFFILFFVFIPKPVLSLAGWAEFDYTFKYARDIYIELGDPSDMCYPYHGTFFDTQRCLILFGPEDEYGFDTYFHLDRLVAINVPQQEDPPFILGRSYDTGRWILYAFSKDEVVYENEDFEKVLGKWRFFGNTDPAIVDL